MSPTDIFLGGAALTLIILLLTPRIHRDVAARKAKQDAIVVDAKQHDGVIQSERAELIPLLKDAIFECSHTDPQYAWRNHHIQKIGRLAPRFSTFLKGDSKTAFDAAWYKCCQTQDAELLVPDVKAAQKLITSRLQSVLDCVEGA
jgi:hypothetical protein